MEGPRSIRRHRRVVRFVRVVRSRRLQPVHARLDPRRRRRVLERWAALARACSARGRAVPWRDGVGDVARWASCRTNSAARARVRRARRRTRCARGPVVDVRPRSRGTTRGRNCSSCGISRRRWHRSHGPSCRSLCSSRTPRPATTPRHARRGATSRRLRARRAGGEREAIDTPPSLIPVLDRRIVRRARGMHRVPRVASSVARSGSSARIGRPHGAASSPSGGAEKAAAGGRVVETKGVEPSTYALRTRRSTN